MPIINIGSINVDHAYRLPRFIQPGETLACASYVRGLGGKGMNQSIALARAGAQVAHLGAIGQNDQWAKEAVERAGLRLDDLVSSDVETGHAIIQIDAAGENCILLYPGANHALTIDHVHKVLAKYPMYQWVLLQNETNVVGQALALAADAGRRVVFNPAPCDVSLAKLPLERLAVLLVNELEACQLTGCTSQGPAFAQLCQRCPDTLVVMTLGAQGLIAARASQQWALAAQPTHVVDTTGAGDTITGYLLAGLDEGMDEPQALAFALKAAAITVSRMGAAASIPMRSELV